MTRLYIEIEDDNSMGGTPLSNRVVGTLWLDDGERKHAENIARALKSIFPSTYSVALYEIVEQKRQLACAGMRFPDPGAKSLS